MDTLAAITSDGVRLRVRRRAADGPRRAALLCTHAMMARSSYMAGAFADRLAAGGIEVYLLDWRGHGGSRPPDPGAAAFGFDDYVRRDLPAAVAAVSERAGVAPGALCYLGHSLGGLAGLAAIGTGTIPPPARASLWATCAWLPGPRGSRLRRAVMRAYAWSARPLGRAPIRRLGLGTDDEGRAYVDQLDGWARSGQWTSRGGVDYLAALRDVRVPVWPVAGEGDRLCTARDVAVLTSRLPAALPIRRVGAALGDAADASHFSLFTDRGLAPLWDELAAFVRGDAPAPGVDPRGPDPRVPRVDGSA